MLTSPPTYPLSQEEFRRAVAAGLGRAWIQAMRHDAAPYRAAIVDAATHCRIYDPQCEGLRGAWLADLCQSAGVVEEVLAAPAPDDSRDEEQRRDLLREFDRRGVSGIRVAQPSEDDDDEEEDAVGEPRALPVRESVEQVLRSIRSSTSPRYGLGFWGRKAGPEELDQVLSALAVATEPRALENALRCLAGSQSPPTNERVFELTAHRDEGVRRFAGLTLGRIRSEKVRTFARSWIESGELSLGVRILRRSAQPADRALLTEQLVPLADPEAQHDLVFGLIDLLESSPDLSSTELALYCYDRSPCGNCRRSAVRLLDRWSERPDWVTEELAYDVLAADDEETAASTPP